MSECATHKCAYLFDAIYKPDCVKPEAKRAVLKTLYIYIKKCRAGVIFWQSVFGF